MHWLSHIAGLDNASGAWYLWWSGLAADLPEFAVVWGLIALARKHTCHIHRCWRVGRHPVDGTTFVVCRRHHPEIDKVTPQDLVMEDINV